MTLYHFFGCAFLAFSVPFWLFVFTVWKDPLRVIVLITSAFFWLLSLFLSSVLWYAVVPLRSQLAFGLVFSVLFQEAFRLAFYALLKKAESGLKLLLEVEAKQNPTLPVKTFNRATMSYVSGLGFGIMSGIFSMLNVLAASGGPGIVGINGRSQLFFLTSALMTQALILLHTCWSVVFHSHLDKRQWWAVPIVVGSHMLISCLTLLNQTPNPQYAISLVPAFVILLFFIVWALHVSGLRIRTLKEGICCCLLTSDRGNVFVPAN